MNIAPYIDHTLLRQDASRDEIRTLCDEAVRYSFASVCVNPWRVPLASELLAGSDVTVCAVTGFPLGATATEIKLAESRWCLEHGAGEIDTVMNIGAAKDADWDYVSRELTDMVEMVHSCNALLKVIFENCLLDKNEIEKACRVSVDSGVDFVKTSTGFAGGGAVAEDVRVMVNAVGGKCAVKAAGGIRSYEDAVKMIEIGATRLGTSSGVTIISGETAEGGY